MAGEYVGVRLTAGRFLRSVRTLESRLAEESGHALRDGLAKAEQFAKATKKFRDRTGRTRSNIAGEQTSNFRGRLIAKGKVAHFLEYGTKKHVIPAKRAPYLTFFWEKKGIWMRVKEVTHPGTKPLHFMRQAGWRGEEVMHRNLDFYASRAIQRFNGK